MIRTIINESAEIVRLLAEKVYDDPVDLIQCECMVCRDDAVALYESYGEKL